MVDGGHEEIVLGEDISRGSQTKERLFLIVPGADEAPAKRVAGIGVFPAARKDRGVDFLLVNGLAAGFGKGPFEPEVARTQGIGFAIEPFVVRGNGENAGKIRGKRVFVNDGHCGGLLGQGAVLDLN